MFSLLAAIPATNALIRDIQNRINKRFIMYSLVNNLQEEKAEGNIELNEETESDSDDIYKYRINVRTNADTEMKDAEKTTYITKETTKKPLTSSSFSVPSDYGN
ncbi:hypothetical protein Tco_0608785 [Tanacetum coccineum]